MPGQPLSTWTPGVALADFREISFGSYVFPLTVQETSRQLQYGFDKKKIQFGTGDYVSPKSSVAGREIEISGTIGSGMIGSTGNMISTDTDLENERAKLASLQALGRQPLFVRYDRFLTAYLESFSFDFMDSGAFRFADFKCKFYADDPRYFATSSRTATFGPVTDANLHSQGIGHYGNVRAWPTITIRGACTGPIIAISQAAQLIQVGFSKLAMSAGDTLTIRCDPRPEFRNIAAQYTRSGNAPVNALQFAAINDFVNSLDYSQFFPFIEATGNLIGTQLFSFIQSSSSANYTVQISYADTWL